MFVRLSVAMLVGCSSLTLAQAAEQYHGSSAPAASSHSYTPSYSPSHSSSPDYSSSYSSHPSSPVYSSPYPSSSSSPARSPLWSSGSRLSVPANLNLPPPGRVAPWHYRDESGPSRQSQAHLHQRLHDLGDGPQRQHARNEHGDSGSHDQDERPPGSQRPQAGVTRLDADAGISPESARGFFTTHFMHHGDSGHWRADRTAAHLAWERHHRAAFVAWAGLLFWPDVYTDLFYWPLWPDAYDEAYWPYVYDDFFDSIYWAAENSDSDDAYAGPSAAWLAREHGSSGDAGADVCGSDGVAAAWPFAQLQGVLALTAEQRALLHTLDTVAAQAAYYLKTSCPREAPLTPTGRLHAMLARLQAALNAAHAMHTPLMTFYDSLSDEQKVQFDTIAPDTGPIAGGTRPSDATCWAEPVLSDVPTKRIAEVVILSDAQLGKLDELAKSDRRAIAILKAACPDGVPRTPVDRVKAIETRLEAMIQAAAAIQPALQDFYGSLTHEQKEWFNMLMRDGV